MQALCAPGLLTFLLERLALLDRFSAAMDEEPTEPSGLVGCLKQIDNAVDLPLDGDPVRPCRKSVEDPLWSGFSDQVPALFDVSQPSMHLLDSLIQLCKVVEESLGTLAQLIDILPVIGMHAPLRFPVALLMKNPCDLLELLAHSSTPAHFQQQENVARDENPNWLVDLSGNGPQLLFDGSLVKPQTAVPAYLGLDLPPDVLQGLSSILL
jgi:hypothetical protein